MKLPLNLKKKNNISKIIFTSLIITFIILMFSNIFLSGYVKELKKIAEYEGNLLEYDIYNILHEIYSDNIKVEYQKVKYRKNVILNNRIIHGEYEYNLYIKDISQKILVDWEMSENGILSITTIKKNDNKNILYKKR